MNIPKGPHPEIAIAMTVATMSLVVEFQDILGRELSVAELERLAVASTAPMADLVTLGMDFTIETLARELNVTNRAEVVVVAVPIAEGCGGTPRRPHVHLAKAGPPRDNLN